jgi:hypothetical protein
MTLQTAYTQALSQEAPIGGNWRYAIVIPGAAISAGGALCQFLFQGPVSGSMSYAAIYAGKKGAGAIDFDAEGVPVTFDGGTTLTLSAGQEKWSDPLPLALVANVGVVVCYDGLGGSGFNYRRQDGLSGHSLNYLAGLNGAANKNASKSGYGQLASTSSSVKSIRVGAATDFEVPNDPPNEDGGAVTSSGKAIVKAGRAYSSGDSVPGVAGQFLHFALQNPTGSAENAFLDQCVITAETDCVISVRAIDPLPAGAELIGSRCNLAFMPGADTSTSKLHKWFADSVQGGKHAVFKLKAGVPFAVNKTAMGKPFLMLAPGYIAVFAIHSAGVGATLNVEWDEESAAP